MNVATARRFDVVVVGAGAAGLRAAGILTRAGARVAILEARRSPGGRIRTRRPPGWPVPVELGAEFVHGRHPEVFEIAGQAGIALLRIPERHVERVAGRTRPLREPWDRFHRITSRIRTEGADVSVAEFLARSGRRLAAAADRRLFVSLVEGYDAAPLDAASVRALSTAGEGPLSDDDRAQFRPPGGYPFLLRALESAIDPSRGKVFLGTPVDRIAWRPGRVEAITARGTFRAGRVLVTVPVGVLAAPPGTAGHIAFDPDPRPMREALAGLAMGHVVKLVFRFARPLWRMEDEEDPVFFHAPGSNFPTWWTAAPFEAPVLTAWCGGPRASRLLRQSPRDLAADALRELARLLEIRRASVSRAVLDWQFHDWSSDPRARGAYSYAKVGGAEAGRRLARPIASTLFFAGEAVGLGAESGTVGAALDSGREAARRLLR